MLWYLKQALTFLKETCSFHLGLQKIYDETVELTLKQPKEILEKDIHAHRYKVNNLLVETSRIYRADINKKGKKELDKKG